MMAEFMAAQKKQLDEQRQGYEARLELKIKGLALKDQFLIERDQADGRAVEHDAEVAETEKEMELLAAELDELKKQDEAEHERFLVEWRAENPPPPPPPVDIAHDQAPEDRAHIDEADLDRDRDWDDDAAADAAANNEPEVAYTEKTKSHMELVKKLEEKLRDRRNAHSDTVRDKEHAEKKLKEIEKYGAEWVAMGDECVATQEAGAYTYEICVLGNAAQKESRSTDLGSFSDIVTEGGHRYLHYTEGARCFNGPRRSMKAHLVCGPVNILKDAAEPSKCEYETTFVTPLACESTEGTETMDGLHDEL